MREERKLNKAIKQDGVDMQSDILDELKRRYPQYVEQSEPKREPNKRRRVVAISSIAAVAACAAIIVPCSVLLPARDNGGDNGGDSGGDGSRYCNYDEYSKNDVDYTIGEYRENNNLNFLYFDWYEYGEDRITVCYISNSDNEVLCIEESIYLPESDEFVQFSITQSNVYLHAFDNSIKSCDKEHVVDSHTVKWTINRKEAFCIFEDGEYRYFIEIKPGQDENRLFELVAELLETK